MAGLSAGAGVAPAGLVLTATVVHTWGPDGPPGETFLCRHTAHFHFCEAQAGGWGLLLAQVSGQ